MSQAEKLSEVSTYHVDHNGEKYFVEMSIAKTGGYKFTLMNKNGETVHDSNIIHDVENYIFETFINKK
jgi:hypothetical protein